jgi:hypothetical protein
MKWLAALSLVVGLGLVSGVARACPGCQNPNLPMARSTGVLLAPGKVRLGVGLGATAMEVVHESGCRSAYQCASIPNQPLHYHEQVIVPVQLQGSLEWGLSQHLGLEAQIPLRAVGTTVDYSLPDGSPYQPLEGDIHHRDEVLVGLGDPTVLLRGSWVLGQGWWLIARLGTSLPLGKTEPDPFEAGDQLRRHQHIQFGSGTFDPTVGLELARGYGRWQGAAYAQLRAPLYANGHGFQGGDRFLGGAQGGYRFAERALVLTSLEYLRDAPERWGGQVQQDGLLGRQEVLVGASLVFSLGGPQYSILVRTPVYREIFEGSQTEEGEIFAPLSLNLGVQWSL